MIRQSSENYIKWALEFSGKSDGRCKKPVEGVGINDAPYVTQSKFLNWKCSHWRAWSGIMTRVFSENFKNRRPTYINVSVVDEWRLFTKFLEWSLLNFVEGWQLDKDILVKGNKQYGPSTCAYVPLYINCILRSTPSRNSQPLGVSKTKGNRLRPYMACLDIVDDRRVVSYHHTQEEAHKAWQWAKAKVLEQTVAKYMKEPVGRRTDIAEALTQRVWQLRLDHSKGVETKNF